MSNTLRSALVLAALAALPLASADAQGWLEKAKKKAKEAAEATGKVPAPTPAARPAAAADDAATATPAASTGEASASRPGEGAWVNYDFVPGSRPIFVEDFATAPVGDFPRRLEFKDGNMEVAEWKGARFLRVSSWPGHFAIALPEALPERFTLEFDATPGYHNNPIIVRFAERAADEVRFRLISGKGEGGVFGREHQSQGRTAFPLQEGATFRARVMADGKYVKVYINEGRVANIPNAEIGRSNKIVFEVPGKEDAPVFLTNFSVMAGGKKLYDAIAEKGRVATQGIYFDTGSDQIRPQSTPTLKEIGAMLTEHPELKLTIEGHTDDVGAAAANQSLSEKRAAAVKSILVSTYGVDAARLSSKGLGASKPAVAGTTPEARQQNRRVELVRM